MFRGPSASHSPSSGLALPTTEPATDPLLAGVGDSRSVLVAGASGFVGRHLVRRLEGRGHRVRGLSRRPAPPRRRTTLGWWRGDISDSDSLAGAADGCSALMHLVGIAEQTEQRFAAVHLRGTENLLAEATRAGVERVIYVSAARARPDASHAFCRTKFAAEELVRGSGLDHVIFRPSVIYGPEDHFTTALATLLRRLPVFPVLGLGSLRLQPVSVEDVTDALAQSVDRPDIGYESYELAGPERLKFTKIVRIVARTLGLRRPMVHLPRPMTGVALHMAERLGLPTPLRPEQLDLLREPAVMSRWENPLRTVFQLEPLPFRVAVADYL